MHVVSKKAKPDRHVFDKASMCIFQTKTLKCMDIVEINFVHFDTAFLVRSSIQDCVIRLLVLTFSIAAPSISVSAFLEMHTHKKKIYY